MKIDWAFQRNEDGSSQGWNDPSIAEFKSNRLESLTRETIQNSLDAELDSDTPVYVDFVERYISAEELPSISSLREVINLCGEQTGNQNPDMIKEFALAKETVKLNKIPVLSVSDFNTRGMKGPCLPGYPFYQYLKTVGQSGGDSNRAGSHGLGKAAPLACSDLRTIFVSTVWEENEQRKGLVQGRAVLMSFEKPDGIYKATGYWGDAKAYQALQPEQVPETYKWLLRDQVGTTVHINPKMFSVEYIFNCSVREIRDLVASGDAAYWLKIACRSTFYSKMYEVSPAGELVLDGHDLRDLVEFSGFIIGNKKSILQSEKVNPEFGYKSFDVSNGQVLAQGLPKIYVTDKEVWKPISSIFEYRRDDDLKDGEYYIDLDADSGIIEIFATDSQCQAFKDFEKTKEGKAILLNTVFFVAVSKMIETLQDKSDEYADRKWARILHAKAASKNINLNERKSLLATHRILGRPLRALTASILDK